MAKAKKTEQKNEETSSTDIQTTPKKSEVTSVENNTDVTASFLKELNLLAGETLSLEIINVSENESQYSQITIVSRVNRYTNGLSLGKIQLGEKGLVHWDVGIEGETSVDLVCEKSKDMPNIARQLLFTLYTLVIKLSSKVYEEELQRKVEKLTKEIEANPNNIIEDLDEEAYHRGPGVSTSMMKVLKKSAKHLDLYLKEKREPTYDMILGSALHDKVLRPELFESLNYLTPSDSKQSNDGKFAHIKSSAVNFGKRGLDQDGMDNINRACEELHKDPISSMLIKEGTKELSLYCKKQPVDGLESVVFRIRTDGIILNPSEELLKTLDEALPVKLPKDCVIIYDLKFLRDNHNSDGESSKYYHNSGYHLQEFEYSDIVRSLTGRSVLFLFVTIAKDGTFDIVTDMLDEGSVDLGEKEIKKLRKKYVEVFLSKTAYRGASKKIRVMSLPMYAFSKKDMDFLDD